MSVENVKAFLNKAKNDPEMRSRFKELSEGENPNIALISYANEQGFEISQEDIDAYHKELFQNGEISQENLDSVSGGGSQEMNPNTWGFCIPSP